MINALLELTLMRLVPLGLLLCFVLEAQAQSWMALSQQGEEDRFYIDTESIVAKDNLSRTSLAGQLSAGTTEWCLINRGDGRVSMRGGSMANR